LDDTKDGSKLLVGLRTPGAGLSKSTDRKASSDMSALKPYWGKLTVRNFRGGYGNGGIIRSPLSAIALLDLLLSTPCQTRYPIFLTVAPCAREHIRKSAKQGTPGTARQIEAAHWTALARGEVGISGRQPVSTSFDYIERQSRPSHAGGGAEDLCRSARG
jgi:hypothetical protein